jgi:L-ascorbate metabolism protein UlaG (beta-lactamase superfamily)
MVDGFFTRPTLGFPPSATSVTPSATAVDDALAALQVSTPTQPRALNLAAVIVNHSHYDHAMDAPMVVEKTGALLVGSNSTANVGRSRGLAEDRLRIFGEGPTGFCFAPFRLTVLRTGHVPFGSGTPLAGDITTTNIPQTVGDYKEGGTFAIFIRRRGKTMLVQGSAGFTAGALANRTADVVFLAVGGLSLAGQSHRDSYWNEVIGNVTPRRIVPVHWDDLSGPLDANIGATLDGNAGINDVTTRAAPGNIDVRTPVVLEKFDPFEGL